MAEGPAGKEPAQVLRMQYQDQHDMPLAPIEIGVSIAGLSTKSQLTRRASSPKVTLGPCCWQVGLSHHFTILKSESLGRKDE